MSSVRIALQPPPNVDFVVGYPGIPPGARDRPQAAVKGAVEVRVGPAGAKAKWVRVELKKFETLPGGGQANAYFDQIGPSPITLWQSSEDYSVLQSQDLPFLIRIPESIPPSIALEKGAGIRYELVATVCTLGTKGFLRRRKAAVVSQATTIIIDKHELHSTWPVYSQLESRSVQQEGVHLTVERNRTCYGPGDRVSIMAILKSDAVQPVMLRGFEFALKETTIFRAGPQASSRRSGPQFKVSSIGEQKVPLSVTLYNGNQHKAELGCLIPNTHTTTTLNAARHIDINYVITVRAWIGAMQSVMMELPVIVSNWPRNVSEEAVRRIGHAPSLCLTSPSSPATVPVNTSVTRPRTAESYTLNTSSRISTLDDVNSSNSRSPPPPKQSLQRTAPNGVSSTHASVDELGVIGDSPGARSAATIDHPGIGSPRRPTSRGGLGGIQEDSVLGTAEGVAEPRPSVGGRRRPSANAQNRLTITNISEKDAEEGMIAQALPPTRPSQRPWPTAENEKKMLYENAVAKVQKVQGTAAMASATTASDTNGTSTSTARSAHWPTAEDEKIRLFELAQATAKRTQAFGVSSPSLHSRSSSEANSPGPRDKQFPSGVVPAMSAGAALYQQAVSSISPNTSNSSTSPTHHRASPSSPPLSSSRMPYYPSAKEEKEALKRYHDAKLAVDRNQNVQRDGVAAGSSSGAGAPVSYDVLYPEPTGSEDAGGSDMPPPFEASGSSVRPNYLNEKERLRRQYEALDAAALAAQAQSQTPEPPPPSHTAQAPSYSGPPPVEGGSSEKEILRRRLEEQDRVAQLLQQQQQQQQQLQLQQEQEQEQEQERLMHARTPLRGNGFYRAPPLPPSVDGFRPLTAAEEKAQLRAKYEAEQHAPVDDYAEDPPPSRHPYATATPYEAPPPPPPLLPRPPAEYIQETQFADLRTRYFDNLGVGLAGPLDRADMLTAAAPPRIVSPVAHNAPMVVRPFSPFDAGLGYDSRAGVATPPPASGHGYPQPQPPFLPPGAQY